MPFALKQAAVFRIKWPICSFLLLTTLKVSQEKPHQDWTIVCKRCTVETVLRRFSHLAESLGRQLRDKLSRNSNSSIIQHITTSNPKEMYLGLTDIHSDQLSAAVFIFHSGYKLISCCFHLLRDPLLVLSVLILTGLCNEAWRTCETAGEPKRVCSLIWIFQTLWWKVELEFSPPHCTKNVSLTPAFFWWPWRVDVECRFRRNRPMVFSARILNFHRRCLKKQPFTVAPFEWRNAMALRRKLSGSPVEVTCSSFRLEFNVSS